jgi:hypothetical protein
MLIFIQAPAHKWLVSCNNYPHGADPAEEDDSNPSGQKIQPSCITDVRFSNDGIPTRWTSPRTNDIEGEISINLRTPMPKKAKLYI